MLDVNSSKTNDDTHINTIATLIIKMDFIKYTDKIQTCKLKGVWAKYLFVYCL